VDYLTDTGLFRALRPRGPLDSDRGVRGAALEGLVAQHLRAWIGYGLEPRELFFWRTRTGLEVDFVVHGPKAFAAIEVRGSDIIHPKDLKGLTAFLEEYPEARGILLYGGHERLKIGSVQCLPWVDFLKELRPDTDLP
jgi:predicted AAA+ superfamily ATPase